MTHRPLITEGIYKHFPLIKLPLIISKEYLEINKLGHLYFSLINDSPLDKSLYYKNLIKTVQTFYKTDLCTIFLKYAVVHLKQLFRS